MTKYVLDVMEARLDFALVLLYYDKVNLFLR